MSFTVRANPVLLPDLHLDEGSTARAASFAMPEERWIDVSLDPSDASKNTFPMRYYYVPPLTRQKSPVLLFYTGNESPVDNYVKSCGFMWERRREFGHAALVFAEHRFWGKSIPAKPDGMSEVEYWSYMGPEHALKDYEKLLDYLKENELNERVRVVALGGSYGGMLAAWWRLIRPDIVHAALASSAPVLAFLPASASDGVSASNEGFYRDGGASYWRIVSSGHFAPCRRDIQSLLDTRREFSPQNLKDLGVCKRSPSLETRDVASYIAYAFETLAMGDYSFPSDYITANSTAYPVKLACRRFREAGKGFKGLRAGINVFFNNSGTLSCHDVPLRWEPAVFDGLWDRMWCLNAVPQETFFSRLGGANDMFRPDHLSWSEVNEHCLKHYGYKPDLGRIHRLFGAVTQEEWMSKASNIVFTNGGLDPWTSGGLKEPSLKPLKLPIRLMKSGAHHSELMFSRRDDPLDVRETRTWIVRHLKRWLAEASEPEEAARPRAATE